MSREFDIIRYLGGLTGFAFDSDVLWRVAQDCGVDGVSEAGQMTEEMKDKCRIELLKVLVFATPHTTASSTNQHADWTRSNGSQTIDAASRKNFMAWLERLCRKYGDEETLEMLDESGGCLKWANEGECGYVH